MRPLLDILVAWPMPLIWLMVAALLLGGRRLGRRLRALGALLLILSSVPLVGRVLLEPLSGGAVPAAALPAADDAVVIVVPTAGSFRDSAGAWWPEQGSVRRIVAGHRLGARLGLPMIVVGGSPYRDQPAEAETATRVILPDATDVRIVADGRDSADSAAALAAAQPPAAGPVILLTDASHVMRMRASLRHAGFTVAASVFAAPFDPDGPDGPDGAPPGRAWRDVVPSRSGLNATGAALREYVGIAWYLATGRIGISDL